MVDAERERAVHVGRTLDATVDADSLQQLLSRAADAFDAVILHDDHGHRQQHIELAAGAGKHVLVRTPLALSTSAADGAIAACAAAGVRLMVGQALRFLPSHQTVKDSVAAGKLGAAGLVRIHRWECPEGGLTLAQDTGESPLLSRAIREIDLANWLFETLPTEVYSVGRRESSDNLPHPDYVQVHLGFPDGGMAIIDDSQTLPQGGDYYSLSVIGSTGAAYADDHHNMNLLYRGGTPTAIRSGEGLEHIRAQLAEFVASIQEEREPAVSGSEGRQAVLVAEAADASLQAGRAARLVGGRYELV